MAQKESDLGINTLERKHEQRESKTALLLSLRDDVTALKQSLAEEKALTARLTQWIQTTLKPSVKQLRQEMIQGHTQLASKIDETTQTLRTEQRQAQGQLDSKLGSLAAATEQSFARTQQHIERHASEAHARITEGEASTAARFAQTQEHVEQHNTELHARIGDGEAMMAQKLARVDEHVTSLKNGVRDRFLHADRQLEEAINKLSQDSQEFCLTTIGASEQRVAQSTRETLSKWADRADDAMRGWREQQSQTITSFIESQLQEHTEWQQKLLRDVNEQHESAMKSTQAALLQFAESEVASRKEWETLKEKWFSSFLADQQLRLQAAFTGAFREYSHMWNEWRKKSEGQFLRWKEAHEGSVHDAELRTAEAIDTMKLEQARAAEDLKLAVQAEQRQWEDTFSAAIYAHAGSMGSVIQQWSDARRDLSEQSADVSRGIFNVWEEKRRNEEAAHADPAQLVPDAQFPVPRWMDDMLQSRGLAEYGPSLCKRGFDTPTVFATLNAADVQAAGITVPGHQKAILLLCSELDASEVTPDILYQQQRNALLTAAREELKARVDRALEVTERKREALDSRREELLAQGALCSQQLAEQLVESVQQLRSTVEKAQAEATEKQEIYLRESVMRLENMEGANSEAAAKRESYFAEIAVRAQTSAAVEAETADELFKEMNADAISKISLQFADTVGTAPDTTPQKLKEEEVGARVTGDASPAASIASIMALDTDRLSLSTLVEQNVDEVVDTLEAAHQEEQVSLRDLIEKEEPLPTTAGAGVQVQSQPTAQSVESSADVSPVSTADTAPPPRKAQPPANQAKTHRFSAKGHKKPQPKNRRPAKNRPASKRAVPPPPKKSESPSKRPVPAGPKKANSAPKVSKKVVTKKKAVKKPGGAPKKKTVVKVAAKAAPPKKTPESAVSGGDDDFWSSLTVTAGEPLAIDDVPDIFSNNAGDVQGNAKHSYVGSSSLVDELRKSKQDSEKEVLAAIRANGERDPKGSKRWRILYGVLLRATASKFEGLPLLLRNLKRKDVISFKDTGTFSDSTVIGLDEEKGEGV